MRVVVINTGTELLLGDVINTHLAFIARELFPLGLRIDEQRSVPDGEPIRTALLDSFPRADIIFVTGGLGPTTDDITREIVAELLRLEMQHDEKVMSAIKNRFARRSIRFTARVRRQAQVPTGAVVFVNEFGTAPGLYLRSNINPEIPSPHLFLLPGPPRELQPMFRDQILPLLRSIAPVSSPVQSRVFHVSGIGESLVEEAIGEKLLAIPGIELGYCARPEEVDVRIVGEPAALDAAEKIIREALGNALYSSGNESLEEVVVKQLANRSETLAVAESCTGGLIADRITNVSGASAVFLSGYVTYSNEAKIDVLHVDGALIAKHGAVSEEIAREMAEAARGRAKATYAVATTGIAGPTGGSAEKPVGLVFVALASAHGKTVVRRFNFESDRETFKRLAARRALLMLRDHVISQAP